MHIQFPITTMEKYREVVLVVDIIYVNKIVFFVKISRNIKFGKMVNNIKSVILLQYLKQVNIIYMKNGFKITRIFMDNTFEHCKETSLKLIWN